MTPDLSKLKAGDTVHFRCGGKVVVKKITLQSEDEDGQFYILKMEESEYTLEYWGCGSYFKDPHPFDIIRVEAAFRWEDVRPGMGFLYINGERLFWYIGPSLIDERIFVFTDKKPPFCKDNLIFIASFDLTRAPEHDIEAKQ